MCCFPFAHPRFTRDLNYLEIGVTLSGTGSMCDCARLHALYCTPEAVEGAVHAICFDSKLRCGYHYTLI
jgi:hypothetical protein